MCSKAVFESAIVGMGIDVGFGEERSQKRGIMRRFVGLSVGDEGNAARS